MEGGQYTLWDSQSEVAARGKASLSNTDSDNGRNVLDNCMPPALMGVNRRQSTGASAISVGVDNGSIDEDDHFIVAPTQPEFLHS